MTARFAHLGLPAFAGLMMTTSVLIRLFVAETPWFTVVGVVSALASVGVAAMSRSRPRPDKSPVNRKFLVITGTLTCLASIFVIACSALIVLFCLGNDGVPSGSGPIAYREAPFLLENHGTETVVARSRYLAGAIALETGFAGMFVFAAAVAVWLGGRSIDPG